MFHLSEPESQAEFEEYFDLRYRVLRQPWGQPRGSEQDSTEATGQHVTVRDQQQRLLGVGRLDVHESGPAQIRFVAVEQDCRQRGVGRAIMERLEEIAMAHRAESIVLNARENVVGFYEGLDYQSGEPGPTLFGQIKHVQMRKQLS